MPSASGHYDAGALIWDREAEVRLARLRFSYSVALVRAALKVVMKVGDLELSVRSSNRVLFKVPICSRNQIYVRPARSILSNALNFCRSAMAALVRSP